VHAWIEAVDRLQSRAHGVAGIYPTRFSSPL